MTIYILNPALSDAVQGPFYSVYDTGVGDVITIHNERYVEVVPFGGRPLFFFNCPFKIPLP